MSAFFFLYFLVLASAKNAISISSLQTLKPSKKNTKKRKKIGILVHTPGRINLPGVVSFHCFHFSAY